MRFIIPEHRYGALPVPGSGPEERRAESRDRLARLAALDPEQLPMALAFLSGIIPGYSTRSWTPVSRVLRMVSRATRQVRSRFA